MSEPIILRVRHIRESKLCMAGAREWFARKDWSWGEFVANGRPVEDFIATGDPLAQRAVAVALREAEDGR